MAFMCIACLVLFVALFAYLFDSSLPGTSLFQGALGGRFTRVVTLALFGFVFATFVFNKLPSFSDLFSKRF